MTPPIKETRIKVANGRFPLKIRYPVAKESKPIKKVSKVRMYALLYLSASRPPKRLKIKDGKNCTAVSIPSAFAEPVISSTYQSSVTLCIQIAVFVKNVEK
jgi:hypothetical protein